MKGENIRPTFLLDFCVGEGGVETLTGRAIERCCHPPYSRCTTFKLNKLDSIKSIENTYLNKVEMIVVLEIRAILFITQVSLLKLNGVGSKKGSSG